MAETISAREANQHFSRLLARVEGGAEFVVTRNGLPVARIVPERARDGRRALTPDQEDALRDWKGFAVDHVVPPDAEPARFSRDEIYDERGPRTRPDR